MKTDEVIKGVGALVLIATLSGMCVALMLLPVFTAWRIVFA